MSDGRYITIKNLFETATMDPDIDGVDVDRIRGSRSI